MPSGVLIEHRRSTYFNPPSDFFKDGDRLLTGGGADEFKVVRWRSLEVDTTVSSEKFERAAEVILAPDESWFVVRSLWNCGAWRLSDGRCLWTVPSQSAITKAYWCAAVSSDGRWLAVGCGSRVFVVDSTSGRTVNRFSAERAWPPRPDDEPGWVGLLPFIRLHERAVRKIAFLPDNEHLLICHGRRGPTVWSWRGGRLEVEYRGDRGHDDGFALSADGRLASAACRVWDLQQRRRLITVDLEDPVLFSPDAESLISIKSKRRISVLDGGPLPAIMRPQRAMRLAALSADLRCGVTVTRQRVPYKDHEEQATVEFWTVGRAPDSVLVDLAPGPTFDAISATPEGVCFLTGYRLRSIDRKGAVSNYAIEASDVAWNGQVAIGTKVSGYTPMIGYEPRLAVCDLASMAPLHLLPVRGEMRRISPCGRFCAWTEGAHPGVVDLESRHVILSEEKTGSRSGARALELTPGGTAVVVGLNDGSAWMWLPLQGIRAELLPTHRRAVVFATISDDGRRVLIHRFENDLLWLRVDDHGRVISLQVVRTGNYLTARFASQSHDFIVVGDTQERCHCFVERDGDLTAIDVEAFPPPAVPAPLRLPDPDRYPSWPDLSPQQLQDEVARILQLHGGRAPTEWVPPVDWVPLDVLTAISSALGLPEVDDWLLILHTTNSDRLRFENSYYQDFDGGYDSRVVEASSFRIGIAVSVSFPLVTIAFRSPIDPTVIWTDVRNDEQAAAVQTIRSTTAARGGLLVDFGDLETLRIEGGDLLDRVFVM